MECKVLLVNLLRRKRIQSLAKMVSTAACLNRQHPHLVLNPIFYAVNDVMAPEAQLYDLMHDLLIDHGIAGDGVCLHDRQVARQVQREPGVLPAPKSSQAVKICYIILSKLQKSPADFQNSINYSSQGLCRCYRQCHPWEL